MDFFCCIFIVVSVFDVVFVFGFIKKLVGFFVFCIIVVSSSIGMLIIFVKIFQKFFIEEFKVKVEVFVCILFCVEDEVMFFFRRVCIQVYILDSFIE